MNGGSVALSDARVKVGGTVSPVVSDPVGATPPVGRIAGSVALVMRRLLVRLTSQTTVG